MLNELYALSQAISNAGIEQLTNWHTKFKELPKGDCFRVWMAADGSISSIEEMGENLRKVLRKYEPNNGVSFPCFNMPLLYVFPDGIDKKETQKIKKAKADKIKRWIDGKEPFALDTVQEWYAENKTNWTNENDDKKSIGKRVDNVFAVMNGICESHTVESNAILTLAKTLRSLPFVTFRENLEKYIFACFDRGENIKTLLSLLFADKQPQLFFDLKDYREFKYPVAHEKTILWLNEVLHASDKTNSKTAEKTSLRLDAFGGVVDVQDKMGSVKLPGLGDVNLRSMFKDHHCQLRYRKIEDDSFPIGKEKRNAAKTALEWLVEEERKGQTWSLADSKEIVFAYPSVIPPTLPKFVSIFGGSKGESQDKKEARFSAIAKDVIGMLKGLSPDKQPKNVQVFAIRKMDKARSKVVFYRSYTTKQLDDAAKEWEAGCENLPPISLRIWSEKNAEAKSAPESISPEIPFPLQIASIVNSVWKQDGGNAGSVPRLDYYQGIELLLETNYAATERYMLQTLVANSFGLILYLGNFLHGRDKNGYQNVLDRRRLNSVVYLPSLFGLLLYKQKINKETYMETFPYLLGQMLKASDELHALYCKVVRKGDVPPQLAGASVFIAISEAPFQGLAQLQLRIKPYLDWAKSYSRNEGNAKDEDEQKQRRLSGWFLYLFQQFANKIAFDSVVRFNDLDKAQLFIGYLASFPKKQEDSEQVSSDSSLTQGENNG
ncbi:hypothetical protein AGMMS50229_13750 [Campylobacterota bacterium]|nr:hypothetical protein AGMMS50229_13750 [Campylobacterota bacterium]